MVVAVPGALLPVTGLTTYETTLSPTLVAVVIAFVVGRRRHIAGQANDSKRIQSV